MSIDFRFARAVNTDLDFGAPDPIATGDFDDDGLDDVVVASPGGDVAQLALLTANPDLTLTLAAQPSGLAAQEAIATGDIDGDGHIDVVQVSDDSGQATVLYGDGTGAFGQQDSFDVPFKPQSVAVADFDADGRHDVLVGTADRGSLATFRIAQDRSVTSGPSVVEGVRDINEIATGDFNGDGDLDVIGHQTGYGSVMSLLLGDGGSTFALANTFDPPSKPANAADIAVADFNQDGNDDWVLPAAFPNTVTVYFSDGAGGVARTQSLDAGPGPRTVEAVDANRNGDVDLAVGHQGDGSVHLFENRGDGSFAEPRVDAVNGDLDNLNRSASGDFDGDGFQDLSFSNAAGGGLVSLLENKAGDGLLDLNFDLVWTRQVGGPRLDTIETSAVAPDGGLIVVGQQDLRGADPKVVARKLSPEGDLVWSQALGNEETSVHGLSVSGSGAVYLSGEVTLSGLGSLDNHFSTLNSGSGNYRPGDPFVVKLSSSGEQQWFERFGSPDVDSGATDLAIGDDGTIYVLAQATGPFVPGHAEPSTSDDMAITAFSPDGALQWSRLIGSGSNDSARKLAVDPTSGDLIVAGLTDGNLDSLAIDGGPVDTPAPNFSGDTGDGNRGFFLRLDTDAEGDLTQVRQFELNGGDSLDGVSIGPDGAVTVVGETSGLDGSPGVPLVSVQIPYAQRFDADGGRAWLRQDSSANDVRNGQDGHSDTVTGPYGLTFVSGGKRAHMTTYNSEGDLLADVTDTFFEPADKSYDDGISTLSARNGSLYVAGATDNEWAGTAQGGQDGWIARVDVKADTPEDDIDFFDLPAADQVTALYIGYFGRPADEAGRDFWVGEYADTRSEGGAPGTVADRMANGFAGSDEAGDLYPFLQGNGSESSNSQDVAPFVADIFQNLFNRTPEDAGLAFWSNEISSRLDAGEPIGDVIVDVLSGAGGPDVATLGHKIAVANGYTNRKEPDAFDSAEARAIVGGVDATETSLLDALGQL